MSGYDSTGLTFDAHSCHMGRVQL